MRQKNEQFWRKNTNLFFNESKRSDSASKPQRSLETSNKLNFMMSQNLQRVMQLYVMLMKAT